MECQALKHSTLTVPRETRHVGCRLPVKNVPTPQMGSQACRGAEQSSRPYVGVSLDIQVVEVVGVFHVAGPGALQPLDDLSFHFHGYVCGQQGQQQPLLERGVGERPETADHYGNTRGTSETLTDW